MNRRTSSLAYSAAFLVFAAVNNSGWGQSYTYTHTSADDEYSWPFILEDSFGIETDDGVEYVNFTGQDTYFDSSYLWVGDSGRIDGDAWWGNPEFGSVDFYFYNTNNGGIDSFAFDFAWTTEFELAPPVLFIDVEDSNFNSAFLEFDLTEFFSTDDYDGSAGRVSFAASELEYEVDDGVFETFEDIAGVYVYVGDIGNEDGTSEFAIDNVAINGADGTGDPADSDLDTSLAVSTRWLRGTFDPRISVSVQNIGSGATEFTQSLDAGSDPAFQDLGAATGQPVSAGASVSPPAVGLLSQNELSGEYVAQIRTANDLNPLDPDNVTPYTVRLYDPPVLTDNSASAINLNALPTLSITNAVAGPHSGALRAGAEVTARAVTGSGFGVTGFDVGAFVEPAENEMAVASFNRYGQLTDTHTGAMTVDLKMNSEAGSFLNGAFSQPLPSVTWDLEYDLADTPSDSATLAIGEALADKVGVNNTTTAATIVAGAAGAAQTVTMAFTPSPGAGETTAPLLATDLVDVEFSSPGDLYVLQFTYTDARVPGSLAEADLQLVYFDAVGDEWRLAVDANSDAGAAASLFSGSFDDYLASLAGGPAELSAYGVDTIGNRAWAVLDHASVFGLGAVIAPLPGDFNSDGVVDAADYAVWRNHLGDPTETSLNGAGDGENGVDAEDYNVWRSQYGTTSSQAAAATAPAPAAGLLVLASLATLGFRRGGW